MKKIKINFYAEIMVEDNRYGNYEVKYFFPDSMKNFLKI